MITNNNENWHYLAVKSISRLSRGINSNHDGDFYCLNYMHSFCADNALKKHERLCGNHDYCDIVMPSKDKNILRYNSGEKSLNVANLIYFDLESLSIKNHSSQHNLERSYTEKKSTHEACGYSMTLIRSYNKNEQRTYRGKDCMEKSCKDLKDLAMEVLNYKKKEMIPLTYKEEKYYEKKKHCHICKNKFYNNKDDKRYKKYHKVKDHDHYPGKFRDAAHSIYNLRYAVQKEIPIISHNGSNYDYHFIIKELAKEFKGHDFKCLGENLEKYITSSVPVKKINENNKLITCKLKFIESY